MNNLQKNSNISGRSMVEMIGVIAIIGMLTVSIYRLVNRVMDRYKLGRISQQVIDLQKVITSRFLVKADYSDLITILENECEILPSEISSDCCKNIESKCFSENKIGSHIFGGDIYVGLDDDNTNMYYIEFRATGSEVWKNVCITLAYQPWIQNGLSNFVKQCYKKSDEEAFCSFTAPIKLGQDSNYTSVTSLCTKDTNIRYYFE